MALNLFANRRTEDDKNPAFKMSAGRVLKMFTRYGRTKNFAVIVGA